MSKLRGKPLFTIMVVVSVYGRVNGHDVIFEPKGNDYWQCKPGMPEDGIYITEIWAKDDAGNIGYKIAKLYVYDGRCVKIEWVSDDVYLTYIHEDFNVILLDDVEVEFVCDRLIVNFVPDGFALTVTKCEV